MHEYLQGALGWLTAITAFIGALTALTISITPLVKAIKAKRRERRKEAEKKEGITVIHTDSESTEVKLHIKWKTMIVGLVLLFISAGVFDFITKPPRISENEERTNIAWRYFNDGKPNPITERAANPDKLNRAIDIATSVVKDLKGAADAKEQSLAGVPMPPTGEVSAEQRRTILAYGPLNDVATCLWIKGRASEYMNKTNVAVSAYLQLTNYPHARTWDLKGWFWSPTEDALGRLSTLTNTVPQR